MMMGPAILAQASCDAADRLVTADEIIRALQLRCGGEFPGTIAIPSLLELVRKARRFGMKLARPIEANDGSQEITAWVEVQPDEDGACAIQIRHWQTRTLPFSSGDADKRLLAINSALAEFHACLDADQIVLTVEAEAPDLAALTERMRSEPGKVWTEFLTIDDAAEPGLMHWRLLDGAFAKVPGSERPWRVTLVPQGGTAERPVGFNLYLNSDVLPAVNAGQPAPAREDTRIIGRDVAPVLRQPIARIIANAETIRTRLAGPLADEYSDYAADIAAAGQHLLDLVDDLADLEVVESVDFTTAPDHVDLADIARRAAGILGVRAREKRITIDSPKPGESARAIAEFRRVLQVLLNLLGNAIRYAPEGSQVWIRLEQDGTTAQVIVADQGPGLTPEQQARVFEKFERLGRSGDGGSGFGLYISRRLARAMGGELSVESAQGQGARFILSLPANSAVPAATAG